MSDARQVRIVNSAGRTVYNRLYDDGTEILRFESGLRCIERSRIGRGYTVVEGWQSRSKMGAK